MARHPLDSHFDEGYLKDIVKSGPLRKAGLSNPKVSAEAGSIYVSFKIDADAYDAFLSAAGVPEDEDGDDAVIEGDTNDDPRRMDLPPGWGDLTEHLTEAARGAIINAAEHLISEEAERPDFGDDLDDDEYMEAEFEWIAEEARDYYNNASPYEWSWASGWGYEYEVGFSYTWDAD